MKRRFYSKTFGLGAKMLSLLLEMPIEYVLTSEHLAVVLVVF